MGPPIHAWMMRYEAKHKEFTDMAKATRNFQNIPKTLSERHQENQIFSNLSFDQVFVPSSIRREFEIDSPALKELVESYFGISLPHLTKYNFLKVSGNEIREGLFVFNENNPFEIEAVLAANDKYFLLCNKYHKIGYNHFLNSIEIEKTDFRTIFKLKDVGTKTYEKKFCDGSLYIIIETLDMIDM